MHLAVEHESETANCTARRNCLHHGREQTKEGFQVVQMECERLQMEKARVVESLASTKRELCTANSSVRVMDDTMQKLEGLIQTAQKTKIVAKWVAKWVAKDTTKIPPKSSSMEGVQEHCKLNEQAAWNELSIAAMPKIQSNLFCLANMGFAANPEASPGFLAHWKKKVNKPDEPKDDHLQLLKNALQWKDEEVVSGRNAEALFGTANEST
jgi:hypothetical protein